jgi:hypothetical protein
VLKNLLLFFAALTLLIVKPVFAEQGNQHNHASMHDQSTFTDISKRPRRPAYYAELEPLGCIEQNKPVKFRLTIKKQKNQIAAHKDFRVTHGRRLHLLSINKDLQDYRHLHPRPDDLDSKAIYEFEVTPTQSGTYYIYADVLTQEDNVNYILPVAFDVPGKQQPAIVADNIAPGEIQNEAFADGFTFTATTSPDAIKAGESIMLDVTVSRDGKAYRRLEPTMQAYAHLVGFDESLGTLVHSHPMGEKLTSSSQRGGPNLQFHLVFPSKGKYRLYLQIKAEGKDIFVPFDVNVK